MDYGAYGASICVMYLRSPNTVVGVAGRLRKTHIGVDDTGAMLLRYPTALCRFEMTWTEAVSPRLPHNLHLYGTEGTILAGRSEVRLHSRQDPEGRDVPLDELSAGRENGPATVVDCIRSGEDPMGQSSPDVSRSAQEIVEAGLIFATTGIAVSLPVENHLFRG